jgi:hypothetical protein
MKLPSGNFFIILTNTNFDSRTATCTAIGLVRCLTLDRDAFVTLIGTTAERNYDDDHKLSISSNSSAECLTPLTPTGAMMIQSLPSFSDVRLTDLKVLNSLPGM